MAIVHDLAEAIVGDISPHCGVSIMPLPSSPLRLVLRCHAPALQKCLTMLAALQVSDEEKFRRESEAMAAIRSATGDSEVGREIERLWKEYEAGETPEAKGVKVGASETSSVLVHLVIIVPSRSKRNMSHGHEIYFMSSHEVHFMFNHSPRFCLVNACQHSPVCSGVCFHILVRLSVAAAAASAAVSFPPLRAGPGQVRDDCAGRGIREGDGDRSRAVFHVDQGQDQAPGDEGVGGGASGPARQEEGQREVTLPCEAQHLDFSKIFFIYIYTHEAAWVWKPLP